MQPAKLVCLSSKSIIQANECCRNGHFGKAFAHLLLALKLQPNFRTSLKKQFCNTLKLWGNELEAARRFNDLFTCYEQAIDICPDVGELYLELGLILLRLGSTIEATHYFRKYLRFNPWDIEAINLLENSCNLLIERWHFRMLNDTCRNEAFREAILKKVRQGFDSILDIGTGTGILSLFAVEGGAQEVYACDVSKAMTDIAKQVLEYHDVSEVKLMNKHSTQLQIPNDLASRVNLVVCEIVDCGLLGEEVLQTLIHARKNLLQPRGVIIPSSASFHVCGVEAPHIAQTWIVNKLPEWFRVDKDELTTVFDSYDTECFDLIPSTYTMVTEVATPLSINFNNESDMEDVLNGKKDCTISLKCIESGTIHCLMSWFSLTLDKNIRINSGPGSKVKCWDQTVFPCAPPCIVRSNEEVPVNLSFKSGKFQMNCLEQSLPAQISVTQRIVKFLNDMEYVKCLEKAAETLSVTRETDFLIFDCCPVPILGLKLLKARNNSSDKLICSYITEGEKKFIEEVASRNELLLQVKCIKDREAIECLTGDQKFDVIVLCPIDMTGELIEEILSNTSKIRKSLKQNGVVFPSQIEVCGQLVESEWLNNVSRVRDSDGTCGYNIAPFLNIFKVDHHIDFKFSSISAQVRSEIINLLEIKLEIDKTLESSVTAEIVNAGKVNALVYWFCMKFNASEELLSFNTLSSQSYFNQAAFLLESEPAAQLLIEAKYQAGIFRIRKKC